ncbi:MAG: prolyl oligopeptidase family serine peptidase [Candidatus Latescibacteria bacterium]|jgi:cephalosporin-C deacetylase|nr:prolyl oligopeptidase family serine peptidase [Candidatus Latescibacterota bacterium]
MKTNIGILFLLIMISGLPVGAEAGLLEIKPDKTNFLCALGEQVTFDISGTWEDGRENCTYIHYRISQDCATTIKEVTAPFPSNGTMKVTGAMDEPGFLRCDVMMFNGPDTVRATSCVGVQVNAIRPTGSPPKDFDRFWRSAKAELIRIPMDPIVEPVHDSTLPDGYKIYKISLASTGGGRVHGWFTVPEGKGTFPAVLFVPGAGVRPTSKATVFTRAGLAVLSINVHGIDPDKEIKYYQGLRANIFKGDDYFFFNKKDPHRYYHYRVIQDCIRAVDFLHTCDKVDSSKIGICGGSQGGFLSLITPALDKRIKAASLAVPAMCDITGPLYGRHTYGLLEQGDGEKEIQALSYYDVALAASLINIPVQMRVGFLDNTCPPTAVYSAYNNLRGKKEMIHLPLKGHNIGGEWLRDASLWLLITLQGN